MRPLFQAYPQLGKTLKHIDMCTLPTPIQHLRKFGKAIGHPQIYIKRDDLSGDLFGSNKVRAIEFLLASANSDGGNVVVGLAGTSMALATNIYAHKFGIPITTILLNQTHTREAQRNLQYFQHVNAKLIAVNNLADMQTTVAHLSATSHEEHGHDAFILSPMSPLGMCGYINAIFELKQQIENGELPEPDFIYLSTGLLGTVAGFTLGLKAAGLKTQLIGCNQVQSRDDLLSETQKLSDFFNDAMTFLKANADDFPDLSISADDIHFQTLTGDESQKSMPQFIDLLERMQALENITLDLTWTARAVYTLENDIKSGKLDGKTVLYWHTHNSRPYPAEIHNQDYKNLPQEFWHYFETDEFELVNQPRFLD